MELKKLLQNLDYHILQGSIEKEIQAIEYDSRKAGADTMFVCIKGFQTDGHRYAQAAVQQGATALLVEDALEQLPDAVTVIQVADTKAALAQVSAVFFENPSQKMHLVGITGTNGKTTTTYLIRSVLMKQGKKVGLIGTIENRIGDQVIPTQRTTPESRELQELFQQMVKEGVTDAVMEVSSHALCLHRVDGLAFEIGVFTNLTQDHLDYHKTMENYRAAKGMLFSRVKKAVINADDAAGAYMAARCDGQVLTYAIDADADLKAEKVEVSLRGTSFQLDYAGKTYPVHVHTPGRFSVYNALAAMGACIFLGIPMEDIIQGLRENEGVHGRFQSVPTGNGSVAIVDYAHTPDGLENILQTAKDFAKGKIIAVFGCGGDRDRTKRPVMGEIGGKYADLCILTSDNPRTEDPLKILREVEAGTSKTGCPYLVIPDRREAICKAVALAKENDVILIAGKGHETYQIFADRTIHFDDVEEVRKAVRENK